MEDMVMGRSETSPADAVAVDLARRMIDGPCSAKDAVERIEKYLAAPIPVDTKLALCRAAIIRWRELGANR